MVLSKEIESLITQHIINDLNFPEDGDVICHGDIPHILMYAFAVFNRGNILREAVHIHITDWKISISIGIDKQMENGIIIYSESYTKNIECLLKQDVVLIMDHIKSGFSILFKFIGDSNSEIKNAESKLIEKFNDSESKLGSIHIVCNDSDSKSISYCYLNKDGDRVDSDSLF